MKLSTIILLSLTVAASPCVADSISFRETYADRLVSYSDEGSVFFDVVSSSSGTINASLTVPGLGSADLDDPELVFSFSVGGAEFSATLGEADTGTANSAVWFLYDDSERRAGQVSVSRVGDVARLSATARGLEGTIAAGEHTEDAEPGRTVPVAGQVPFRMELGGFSATRTLYYRGTASRVIRRVGSGEEAEEFELARVTLTGAADYTRPTITITSPRPGQRWSNEVILVTGRATDNVSVGEVMLSLNGEDYAAIESLEGGT